MANVKRIKKQSPSQRKQSHILLDVMRLKALANMVQYHSTKKDCFGKLIEVNRAANQGSFSLKQQSNVRKQASRQ